MALRQTGGALLSLKSGFHALDFATGEVTRIVDPDTASPAFA